MCDVAYAALMQQHSDDARAAFAAGSAVTPQDVRDALDERLFDESQPVASNVAPDVAELRRELGVA